MVLLGTTPWWTHWKHEELFGNLTKTSWELSEENTLGTKKKKTQDIQQSPSPKERKTLTSLGFPNLRYLLGLINLYYNVKNIEFSEYTNAIIYAWLLCRWFHSFGLITKTKLTIDEETLANFIKQSTQQRGKGKGRNKERERERKRGPKYKNQTQSGLCGLCYNWLVLNVFCLWLIKSLVGFMRNYQVALFTFVNEYGCGKKVTELQRRRRRRRWECSDPNLSPQKQNKHMPFNKTHLDQLVSSTTTDFGVSIESHAGSTKVSPKLPFSFYTRSSIFLPQSSNPDCSAPLLFSKLQKKLKNEAPFLHFIWSRLKRMNEWMKWLNLSQP